MDLYRKIIETYPELKSEDFSPFGLVYLRDDSDGEGVYIAEWNYSKPIPEGLKLGK